MKNLKNFKIASVLMFSILTVGCSNKNENVYDDMEVEGSQSSQSDNVLDNAIRNGNQANQNANNQRAQQSQTQQSQTQQSQVIGVSQETIIANQNIQLNQNSAGQKVYTQRAPAVPDIYYSPNQFEVTSSLAVVLTKSIIKMKEGEERDKYYQEQIKLIQELKVNSCGKALLNNPLECDIILGGRGLRLKMVYTQSGWFIIK